MPEPTAGEFRDGAHWLPVRIYYEDTDHTGVVYHANFLRYMERGRSDFLRLAGVDHAFVTAQGAGGFAVVRVELDYRKPARVDDALTVRTVFHPVKGVRLQGTQQVLRGDEVLVDACVIAVCIGADGRPKKPPREMIERLLPWLAKD